MLGRRMLVWQHKSLICNSNNRIYWWDHKHCSIAPFSPPLWGKKALTSQVMPLETALNMCKSIRVGKPQSLSRNQRQHRFKHQVYQAASCTAVFLTTVPGRHCSSVCTAALKELTVENTCSKSPALSTAHFHLTRAEKQQKKKRERGQGKAKQKLFYKPIYLRREMFWIIYRASQLRWTLV